MQDKTKQQYLTENELKLHIKSGNFAPCYMIFGEEHYLIKTYVEKAVKTAVTNFEDFNVSRFDGKTSIQEVYDAVQSFPMMTDRKIVTLCDYPFDKAPSAETEKLLSMIADMPATTVFVLWFETVEINPKKTDAKFQKLMKAVREAGGEVCYLGRKTESEIMKMLQSGAARRKRRMDATTARYMIETCSDDLGTLINELEKLCLYVAEDGNITREDIDKICSRSVEASVYNVSKAVLRGDLQGALKLLDDLFYMNTDAAYILTFLSSAYIDIYRCFAARSKGERTETIAKEFGYGNLAFRLNDAERNMRKFSEQQITESLKCLSRCDEAVKGSRVDGRTALEKTLVELVVIAQGKAK
ncbi:MAG: DNA polymerase III subunit delta [Clostridia bacterium]|nr:DNA polymerase III subunit delta [Clostridia bacterium]